MVGLTFLLLTQASSPRIDVVDIVAHLAKQEKQPVVALASERDYPRSVLQGSRTEVLRKLEGQGLFFRGGALVAAAWPRAAYTYRLENKPNRAPLDLSRLTASPDGTYRARLGGDWQREGKRVARFHDFYSFMEVIVSDRAAVDPSRMRSQFARVLGADWDAENERFDARPAEWRKRTLRFFTPEPADWSPNSARFLRTTLPEWTEGEIAQLLSKMSSGVDLPSTNKPLTVRYVLRAIDYFLNGPSGATGITPEQADWARGRSYFDATFKIEVRSDLRDAGVAFRARANGSVMSWVPVPPPTTWRQGG